MKCALLLIPAVLLALSAQAGNHRLVKKWESEPGLAVPESVLLDTARNVLYVSNIEGEPWADDGRGSIARVGLDGKIIAARWVTGLSAPKGLALRGNRLYVADLTNVAVIDIDKGVVVERLAVPGSEGLNDVTLDPDGVIFVSDSKALKVFEIRDGKSSVRLDKLQGPNGLLFQHGKLHVLDGTGLYRQEQDRTLTRIADGMEGMVDGLESVSGGDFLVSCWKGTIHYVHADGTREVLLDTRKDGRNTADIDYDEKKRIVYVPTFFANTIVAYELQ